LYYVDLTKHLMSSFEDPGPHGNGRYSEHMLPEVEKKDWRKGAQVSSQYLQINSVILNDFQYLSNNMYEPMLLA
jgi:Core-2/I-Branching enzyme